MSGTFPVGSPPATGTGTLQITLEDVNDNAPSIYPMVAMVCEDQKDVKVILGALDKDLRPNTEPFKFELSKQSGQEKVWKVTRINNTHAQVILPPSELWKKAPLQYPLSLWTDSGRLLLTNNNNIELSKMQGFKFAAPLLLDFVSPKPLKAIGSYGVRRRSSLVRSSVSPG
uniref:Cadherin-13 n=1 Tax=Sphaerodactylus townsendi TaxID=933632 RepID=A0ACB8EAZ5_9SAUR